MTDQLRNDAPAAPSVADPGPAHPADPPPIRVVDADELARLAAETVALIEHHRAELRATMAELTALQRSVRSELRSALAEAAQLAEALDPTGPIDPVDR